MCCGNCIHNRTKNAICKAGIVRKYACNGRQIVQLLTCSYFEDVNTHMLETASDIGLL